MIHTYMVILLVISIICLIVSLCLFINSRIVLRHNKKDIPDWDNMTVEEIVDTLNEPQKRALYFLVSKAAEEAMYTREEILSEEEVKPVE